MMSKQIKGIGLGDSLANYQSTLIEEFKSKIDIVDGKLNIIQTMLDKIGDSPDVDYQKVNGWTCHCYTDLGTAVGSAAYRGFGRTIPIIGGYAWVATKVQKFTLSEKSGEFYIILSKLINCKTTYDKQQFVNYKTSNNTLCIGEDFDPDTIELSPDEIIFKCTYNGTAGNSTYSPPVLVFDIGQHPTLGYYNNSSYTGSRGNQTFFYSTAIGNESNNYISFDLYRAGIDENKYLQGLLVMPWHWFGYNVNGDKAPHLNLHNGIFIKNNGVNLGEITTEFSGTSIDDFMQGKTWYINFTPLVVSLLNTGVRTVYYETVYGKSSWVIKNT